MNYEGRCLRWRRAYWTPVLLLAGQFSRLRGAKLGGLRTDEQLDVEVNRLADRTLALLAELPKRALPQMAPVPTPTAIDASKLQSKLSFCVEASSQETLLGINNLRQISWIQRGTVLARSVCRVLTPAGVGTGFLVASDVLMTNHHVIRNANVAAQSIVEFDYEYDVAGKSSLPSAIVSNRLPLREQRYAGFLACARACGRGEAAAAELGLHADEYQCRSNQGRARCHRSAPNGGLKQIAMTENHVVNVEAPLLYYSTDTMPGSSGSLCSTILGTSSPFTMRATTSPSMARPGATRASWFPRFERSSDRGGAS